MIGSDVITRVQRQFGDENESQIYVDDIMRWINDAQLDIARKTDCLKTQSYTTSVSGRAFYDFPTDCLKPLSIEYKGEVLVAVTRQTVDAYDPGRDVVPATGTPGRWYSHGQQVFLHPAPGATGDRIDLWYSKRPVEYTDTTRELEVPTKYHLEVVKYCLAQAKELDEDDNKAASLRAEYESSITQDKDEDGDSYPAVRALPGDDGDSWTGETTWL